MDDRHEHRDRELRDHRHRDHQYNQRRSSAQRSTSPPTRAAKHARFDNDATQPADTAGNSHRRSFSSLSRTAVPRRSFSSLSRTTVPRRLPARSYGPPVSYHERQRRQPYSQGPTLIEKAVSQLRMYMENRLKALKEQLCTWETNGRSYFSGDS